MTPSQDADEAEAFMAQAVADCSTGYAGPCVESEPVVTAAQLLDSASMPPLGTVRVSCCDALAIAYPRYEPLFMARKLLGLERYGVELDPFNDERDMLQEAVEEFADGCVYLRAAIERELTQTRLKGRHNYLTMKQALQFAIRALDCIEEVRGS